MGTENFTVVLLYPDYATEDYGADISVQWVTVPKGPIETMRTDAARVARIGCMGDNSGSEFGEPPGADLRVIAMFEGHVGCVADATHDL
jgi:hypothetical protein